MANALTLVDGLAVVGGGISAAWPLFLPALVEELNSSYSGTDGTSFNAWHLRRSTSRIPQVKKFIEGETREITVPGSRKKIVYDPLPRIGIRRFAAGTSEAVIYGVFRLRTR